MTKSQLFALAITAALLAGCERRESTPAPETTGGNAAPTVTPTPAQPAVPPAPPVPAMPATPAVPSLPKAAESTTNAAAAHTSAAVAEAQTKLDQVMQYIKENKYDLADKSLKQLEEMRSTLPAALAERVTQARQMLSSYQATQQAPKLPSTMPSVPGLGR